MIESINHIDTQLFLFLNGKNSPFWDIVMWYVSGTLFWLPLYLIIFFFIFKRLKWQGLITIFFLLLLILVSDQGSVHIFKNVFQRLRPCHQPEIANLVHLVSGKCGGQYGFISSHAANTFAFAMFISLFFKNLKFSIFIFIWAAFVSYSRIYLGVHYPFDVLVGALYGMFAAYLIFLSHQYILEKYSKRKKPI
jgi:undecaprenyl-diphosphatase